MTFAGWGTIYRNRLSGLYDAGESDAIYRIVVDHYFSLSPAKFLAVKADIPAPTQEKELENALAILETGLPVQYLVGETWFRGLPFRVSEAVLIPRPETEELVLLLLEGDRALPAAEALNVLDIGTGSGCIPVSLKKARPTLNVWSADVSAAALALAKENASRNQVEVTFLEMDVLAKERICVPGNEQPVFDAIVSNPPYIPESESAEMHANVTSYEPHIALFVPDDDPLVFYRKIATLSLRQLKPGGTLYFEVHEHFSGQVAALLAKMGFTAVKIIKDLNGKSRFVVADRGRKPQAIIWVPVTNGHLAIGHKPGKKLSVDDLKANGTSSVLTLLQDSEGAHDIGNRVRRAGMNWIWLPFSASNPGKWVDATSMKELYDDLAARFLTGERIYIHCSAGIHRTGMITFGLLRFMGFSDPAAIGLLQNLREVTFQGLGERLGWMDTLA